jgi:RNA polymerase-interacting CarD/CdnL/TRCF family regulator
MSDELLKLEKGDVIVRFGVLHKIFQVEEVALEDGRKNKIIHFQPLYKNRRNETLRLSIPVNNIDRTTIRLPINKTEMREELKFLRQAEYQKAPFNRIKVKRIISANEIHDLAEVLKTLWEEKRDEDKSFTISKRNTLGMVMDRFQQEVAHVLGISLTKAETKITDALDVGWNRHLKSLPKDDKKE